MVAAIRGKCKKSASRSIRATTSGSGDRALVKSTQTQPRGGQEREDTTSDGVASLLYLSEGRVKRVMAEDANTLRSINDLVIALIGNPLLLLLGSTAWSDGSTIVGAIVTRCSERARATALIARRDELRRVRRLLGRSVSARGRYLRYRDCDRRHAG